MGGRPLLLALGGLFVISARIFLNITQSSTEASGGADAYFLRQTAEDAAQGGVKLGLRQMANNPTWRTGFSNLSFNSSRITVTVTDSLFNSDSAIVVRGVGIAGYGTGQQVAAVSQAFVRKPTIPPTIKAAISGRNAIFVNGGFAIDGRDHTVGGALISNAGTFGIWTTQTFTQSGSSTVGGTAAGVDYVPTDPGNAAVIMQNQAYPGGYPGTPDSVLGGAAYGFPEGSLKSIAQSRAGGSQYSTNGTSISLPLKGVTYVELPSGGIWDKPSLTGSGILVVHNSSTNAIVRNVLNGNFVGLIIIDDPDRIKCDIVGALVILREASSGIGNSNGSFLYSKAAVKSAIQTVSGLMIKNGSAEDVIAWKE